MSALTRHKRKSTVTILSSETDSSAWDVDDVAWGSILIPAAFTGTSLSIEGRYDNSGPWFTITEADGTVLAVTKNLSTIIRLPDAAFAVLQLRFVSSSSEGADRTLVVFAKG